MEVFEWNEQENQANIAEYGVSFEIARRAFLDSRRLILEDTRHPQCTEKHPQYKQFLCIADVDQDIMVVRFSYQGGKIRIFAAGYWR